MRGSQPPTTELPGSPGRTVGRRRACSTLLGAHAESNGRRPVADATVGFTHGTEVVRVARVSGVRSTAGERRAGLGGRRMGGVNCEYEGGAHGSEVVDCV